MLEEIYGIYGASGCGRSIMPVARSQLERNGAGRERLFFIDDSPSSDQLNGHRVLSFAEFLDLDAVSRNVAFAIADGRVRESVVSRCLGQGVQPWEIRSEHAIVMDDVNIAEGALLSPFVSITSNIRIGRFFHANLYSYVEHDCCIGDFVTFAPGVKCNGNVVIENHVYVGAGAVIKQGRPDEPLVIGEGATVGMGSVVTRSVAPGVTVVGNPARVLYSN